MVPPLCPLVGSPYDSSRTAVHIDRAILSADGWLAQHGLQQVRFRMRCGCTATEGLGPGRYAALQTATDSFRPGEAANYFFGAAVTSPSIAPYIV